MTPRRVNKGFPSNLTYDPKTGLYRYRNPINGKRKYFGRDKNAAFERAKTANKAVELERAKIRMHNEMAPTISYIIDLFVEQIVPTKPWAEGTLKNNLYKLELYKREFGNMLFAAADRAFLADWIRARCTTADCRNGHQRLLADLWAFAISRKITNINEPALMYKSNKSMKVKANQKARKRLQIEQFWQIHDHKDTPGFLQRAMRLALITRQGRSEICNMEYPVDGWFYVVRQKTAASTELAFMRFPVVPELKQIIVESREDGIACPYIIHMRPLSMRPQHQKNKLHWAAVNPEYLTKAFAKARDAAEVGADLQKNEKPTFHEIRSLGSRILRAQGWSVEDIQQGLAHTDEKTTHLYLSDPGRITKEHYNEVRVGLDIDATRAAK